MATAASVVVAWVTEAERAAFLEAWRILSVPPWLVLQHDSAREGCGATKNKGIRRAVQQGAEIVVVLDGDCYPTEEAPTLETLVDLHCQALQPQQVKMFQCVTEPASRGTPYGDLTIQMPVAASMGFWLNVPDYCAVRQLAFASKPVEFCRESIHGRYFPLCGMNVAFRPLDWWPWCQFIEVSRFDDIWAGWLWQREAYRTGHCFNLAGPLVYHSRQSNVWKNLIDEAVHLEANEMLWRQIALAPSDDNYEDLLKLLPAGTGRLSLDW